MKIRGLDKYIVTSTGTPSAPYEVAGPRQKWMLVRNQQNPKMLFVMGLASTSLSSKIHGYSWFREEGEELIPVG